MPYHLTSIADPTGRNLPLRLQQEEGYYFTAQQEEERISPCLETDQPMRDCHSSTNENFQFL